MVPKQRKGGSFGGSGHGESKFKSVRRGGRPGSGRAKKADSAWPCAVVVLAGGAVLAVAAGAVTAVVS